MKLVAGLGNPGRRYAESRHNVGYLIADELARRSGIDVSRHESKFQGFLGNGPLAGQLVLLLKPTTYMNLSGQSVAAVRCFYKLEPADVLIAYDDLDLPVGRLRLRKAGSAGGHRGMLDVIRHLGDDEVSRVRLGIGSVHRSATVEYVLNRFNPDERVLIEAGVSTAADAVERWLRVGIDAAMNEFNTRGPRRADGDEDRGVANSQGESP